MADEQLIRNLRAGETAITDFIMEKYKFLVKKHAKAMFLLGGENDDFRHASIQIEDIAHVKLAASFKAYTLAIEEGSTLDLNNSELVVAEASINGVHLGSGVYFPTDEEVAGYLLDTSAEAAGSLRVTGSALIIIVK